jgi:hypothetical protein
MMQKLAYKARLTHQAATNRGCCMYVWHADVSVCDRCHPDGVDGIVYVQHIQLQAHTEQAECTHK